MPIIYFLIVFVTGLTVGLLGSTRRLGFWLAFFLSFLITPPGAAIVAILTGSRIPRKKRQRS